MKYTFILSGSANLLLMKQVSESLAGRVVYFVLDPLTLGEINQSEPGNQLLDSLNGAWLAEGTLAQEPVDPTFLCLGWIINPRWNRNSPTG